MHKVPSRPLLSISNDSVCGQKRLRSDCADAQSDLGLCCPHIPEDIVSHGRAEMKINTQCGN